MPKVHYGKKPPLERHELRAISKAGREIGGRHWALTDLLVGFALRISECTNILIENYQEEERGYRVLKFRRKGGGWETKPLPYQMLAALDAAAAGRTEGHLLVAIDGLPLHPSSATGLLNTYTGLVIANLTHVLPIAIFLLRGFFLSIPSEIEQAALVDGCGQVGMLTRITMRMAAPGLATVFIYAFVVTWNDLLFARTLSSSGSMWTAPVGLASFQGEYYTLFEPLMAASLVFALPVTVVFLLLQRHFVHGLTVGGVKG